MHVFTHNGVSQWLTVLQREVGQFEPWLALDGGLGPGLDSLTPICSGAAEMLQPGGFLALETSGTADICSSEPLNLCVVNVDSNPHAGFNICLHWQLA